MDETKVTPPFVFRPGKPSERYESLRGSLDLEGKPLLVDAKGPCDTPISGNQRVKVTQETNRAWLVAYLPTGVVEPEGAEHLLQAMLGDAPVAKLLLTAAI
jgi:DNA/RNA-binding domain of Phe-tRNA-synthetase-like protein